MFHRLKKCNKLNNTFKTRLKKVAEWEHIDITDPELIDKLTDAMTYGYAIQIDYQGSGWRNIQPYGWDISKDNNASVMCYKDSGEIRRYRLDRINDIYIDKDTQIATTNNKQLTEDEQTQIYEDLMNEQESDDLPTLPDEEDLNDNNDIYDLQMLDNANDTLDNTNVNDFQQNNQYINDNEFQQNNNLNDEEENANV